MARLKVLIEPSTAFQIGTSNKSSGLVCAFSHISRKPTMATSELGISIPTTDLPGIGASILTSFAAKARAKSSWRFKIRLTFTPVAGLISYFETDGPTTADSTAV